MQRQQALGESRGCWLRGMFAATTQFEVQALLGGRVQLSMVRERTGVSVPSVRRFAGEEPIEDPAEVDRQRAERMDRPSAVRAYADQVGEWLRAAYDLVRRVRVARPPDVLVRFEGMPGEFSQRDLAPLATSENRSTAQRPTTRRLSRCSMLRAQSTSSRPASRHRRPSSPCDLQWRLYHQ